MATWAWHGAIDVQQTSAHLTAVLRDRGFVVASTGRGRLRIAMYSDGNRGTLVLSSAAGGLGIAQALSRAAKLAATYAEIELTDRTVKAASRAITDVGTSDVVRDHDEEASELCSQWFEGKKFRPEAALDLAAVFVDLEDGCPKKGRVDLVFDRSSGGGARVQSLVDAVRAGATWEKTTIGGRPAVRIKDASGTRISVVDEDELAAFERDIA